MNCQYGYNFSWVWHQAIVITLITDEIFTLSFIKSGWQTVKAQTIIYSQGWIGNISSHLFTANISWLFIIINIFTTICKPPYKCCSVKYTCSVWPTVIYGVFVSESNKTPVSQLNHASQHKLSGTDETELTGFFLLHWRFCCRTVRFIFARWWHVFWHCYVLNERSL